MTTHLGTSGVVARTPKPINDNTKNYGLGEYAGQRLGQDLTFKVAVINGSTYTDNSKGYRGRTRLNAAACARASGPWPSSTPPRQHGEWRRQHAGAGSTP